MPIQYYLQPNPNTPDPNDQYARVSTTDNKTLDDIADAANRSGLSRAVLCTTSRAIPPR